MTETLHNASLRLAALFLSFVLLIVSFALGWQVFTNQTPVALSIGGMSLSLDFYLLPLWQKAVWSSLAFVGFVLSLVLLRLALLQPRSRHKQIVLSSPGGDGVYGGGRVTVSLGSLRAILVRTAERVEGVREANPELSLKRNGWHINCSVAITPDASLPAVTGALKTRLKESIEHHTGLPVEKIDIAAQLNPIRDLQRVR